MWVFEFRTWWGLAAAWILWGFGILWISMFIWGLAKAIKKDKEKKK